MTDDLIAFLAARLDEDEAVASNAGRKRRAPWRLAGTAPGRVILSASSNPDLMVAAPVSDTVTAHIVRHDPAREGREVKFKRDMLAAAGVVELDSPSMAHCMLCEMAAVYSDHPDYRAEWELA